MPLRDKYNVLQPNEIVSPQMRAMTGMSPRISYGDYLQGASEALPMIYATEEQKRIADEERALQKQYMDSTLKDRRTGTMVELGKTGLQAYQIPQVQTRVNSILGMPVRKTPVPYTSPSIGVTGGEVAIGKTASGLAPKPMTDMATGYTGLSPMPETMPLYQGGNALDRTAMLNNTGADNINTIANTPTTPTPPQPMTWGGVAARGATGLGANYLMDRTGLDKDLNRRLGDVGGGIVSGAIKGFASTWNPMGAIVGAIAGGYGAKNKGCIIVTACTDPYSYEVKITREFRDEYLDKSALRGYYVVAEKIVPVIEKYQWFKRFMKTQLVDRLVDVGEYKLGKKNNRPRVSSSIVTWLFLRMCKLVGTARTEFTRCTGEVI